MNYFNIQNPRRNMASDECYDKMVAVIDNYMFSGNSRRSQEIHQSTCTSNYIFLTRLISCVAITAVYIWSIVVVQTSLFENIMYLTMIGYFLSWLFFTLDILDRVLRMMSIRSENLYKFIQIIFELAFCLGLPITIVFWVFLFQLVLNVAGVTTEVLIIMGLLHALPLVCLIADFVQNKFSFSIRHLPVLVVLQIIYFMINITYSLTVKPIYKPISWRNVESYMIAIGSTLITFLFHYIGRVVYSKCKNKKQYPLVSQNKQEEGTMQESQHL